MTSPNRNHLWARALIDELARAGVREVVISPGSRSTPLVLAAATDPRLRLLVQVDERSAGFLALGVGKGTGRPGAVITTSGTAVANLLPAVVEAAQSEIPLLLLTADRPPHLRGADANQAIDQVHLFGRYVRMFEELTPGVISERTLRHLRGVGSRAVAAAVGDPAGPVHLNLPFAKPLEPTPVPGDVPLGLEEGRGLGAVGRSPERPFVRIRPRRRAPDPEGLRGLRDRLAAARRPLVVAGPVPRPEEVGHLIRRLGEERGVPVLADALSGARFGEKDGGHVLGGYDLFLRAPRFRSLARPDLILRLGATPTSAVLAGYLEEHAGTDQVVVDGGERWKDHLAVAGEYLAGDPALVLEALVGDEGSAPASWTRLWQGAEAAVRATLVQELEEGAFFEGAAVSRVARWCPPGATLFLSNSMPVRDVDAFVPDLPGVVPALGNRGASGIDGIVSTAAGASLGTGSHVVAVVGDLALIHDMNGLMALREDGIRLTLVVIQNDGGGIFHRLPIREHEPEFTRYFATPHGLEVSRIAELHGLPHTRARSLEELDRALDEAAGWDPGGIVEVPTDRDGSMERSREVAERVERAVEDHLDELPREP